MTLEEENKLLKEDNHKLAIDIINQRDLLNDILIVLNQIPNTKTRSTDTYALASRIGKILKK